MTTQLTRSIRKTSRPCLASSGLVSVPEVPSRSRAGQAPMRRLPIVSSVICGPVSECDWFSRPRTGAPAVGGPKLTGWHDAPSVDCCSKGAVLERSASERSQRRHKTSSSDTRKNHGRKCADRSYFGMSRQAPLYLNFSSSVSTGALKRPCATFCMSKRNWSPER